MLILANLELRSLFSDFFAKNGEGMVCRSDLVDIFEYAEDFRGISIYAYKEEVPDSELLMWTGNDIYSYKKLLGLITVKDKHYPTLVPLDDYLYRRFDHLLGQKMWVKVYETR